MKNNWFNFIKNNKKVDKSTSVISVEKESNMIFKKYEKTFRDLARHDRGEKILSN